jgi:hypothetical protein
MYIDLQQLWRLFIKTECDFENGIDRFYWQVDIRIKQHYFHPGAVFDDQSGVIDPFSFHNTNIRQAILFMCPQVAEHFAFITIKGHPVFPGLGNVGVAI